MTLRLFGLETVLNPWSGKRITAGKEHAVDIINGC
jgi:hypothetical protein